MNNSVTSATYIRNLKYSLRRKLSDFLDPQDKWKMVLVSVRKPGGEFRYSQLHLRKFEGLIAQGKSPTEELLNDWGTSNSTVGELVDVLRSHMLLAAAALLLPVEESVPTNTPQASPLLHKDAAPTQLLTEADPPRSPAVSADPQPPVLVETTDPDHTDPDHTDPDHTGFSSFLYVELMAITGNFDDRPASDGGCRLGEGGFGTVYKGLINDKPVAVKKLNPMENFSLEELQLQFNQEVQTLKALKHENVVDMVGFSCDGQHLCLVYAFMANGSLLDRLACSEGSPPLSWQQRCSIAEGTARGLEYLHSNHHVHRDVKSANILLDENLVAKISDFGLTRASAARSSTTVRTDRIVGTCAYMAPEALRGEITPKSDVFSFGVVLLEILSGLPPADGNREPQFLMDMREDIEDEDEELTLETFVDRKLSGWAPGQVESVYTLACNCLHERKNRRPLIKQVLLEITGVIKSISLDFPAQD